jgi:hypothetical protein
MASSSFKSQQKLKMICLPTDFRMRILEPNETQKKFPSSNQIKWQSLWLMGLKDSSFPYLRYLDEVLEFDPYPFRPLTITSYFFILIISNN